MTLPMISGQPMPDNISTGEITGRVGLADDGSSFEGAQDLIVAFTPAVDFVLDPTSSPPLVIILLTSYCSVDAQGYLCGPNGLRGLTLIATDETDLNPHGWTYRVTFARPGGGALPASFSISVAADSSLDISALVSVVASPGEALGPAQSAAIAAASSAATALSYRDAAAISAGLAETARLAAVAQASNASGSASAAASSATAASSSASSAGSAAGSAATSAITAADIPGQVTAAVGAAGTVTAAAASAANTAVAAAIAAGAVSSKPIPDVVGFDWAFISSDNPPRVVFGQRPNGTFYGADAIVAAAVAAVPPPVIPPANDSRLVTLPVESGWSWALMGTDSRVDLGRRTDGTLYGALDAVAPVAPVLTPIIMIGDSLTANWGNTTLGAKLGRASTNIGIGGQTSPQIAARFGGQPCLLTVQGNAIPASGPVTVTAWSTNMGQLTSDGTRSFVGVLAGVPGTLQCTRTTPVSTAVYSYTFTRTTAGIETPCPALSPFKTGFTYRDALPVICVGRNNFKTTGDDVQVVSDARAIVTYTKRADRALILSIPPWADEWTGGPDAAFRVKLDAANLALKTAFPTMWLDTAAHLRSAAVLASVGITATSQDLTDIGNNITPISFRNVGDDGHYNAAAYTAINNLIAAEYAARGWTD